MVKTADTLVTGVLVLAAVAVAGVTLKREFAGPGLPNAEVRAPTYLPDWRRLTGLGRWIGDSTAEVVIVEFSDYECPFCQRFHQSFMDVYGRADGRVALLYIDFPIPTHRFARPAAIAAECGARQGAFEALHDKLFQKPDSFGLRSWTRYAVDAGVKDSTLFARCIDAGEVSAVFDAGVKAGLDLEVDGTPTILIDGWRFPTPPYETLDSLVRHRLAGGEFAAPVTGDVPIAPARATPGG